MCGPEYAYATTSGLKAQNTQGPDAVEVLQLFLKRELDTCNFARSNLDKMLSTKWDRLCTLAHAAHNLVESKRQTEITDAWAILRRPMKFSETTTKEVNAAIKTLAAAIKD